MLLSAILLLPLIGALVVSLIPEKDKKNLAVINSIFAFLSLILASFLFLSIKAEQTSYALQFSEHRVIFGSAFYYLGTDGISALFILAASIVSFCLSFLNEKRFTSKDHVLSLIGKAGIYGVFCAQNLILLAIMYLLAFSPALSLNKPAKKQVIFGVTSAILSILAILFVIYNIGQQYNTASDFNLQYLIFVSRPAHQIQILLFPFIILAVFIISAIWPFGKWIVFFTDKDYSNPFIISVTSKAGLFILLKIIIPLFSQAIAIYSNYIIAILSVILLILLVSSLLKKDILETFYIYSFTHSALLVIVMMMPISEKLAIGTVISCFATTLILALLFSCAVIIKEKTNWTEAKKGLSGLMPLLQIMLILSAVSSLSIPGFLSFLSFFTILENVLRNGYFSVFMLLLIYSFLTAHSILGCLTELFGRDPSMEFFNIKDITTIETASLMIMLLVLFISGILPSYLHDSLVNSAQFLSIFRW